MSEFSVLSSDRHSTLVNTRLKVKNIPTMTSRVMKISTDGPGISQILWFVNFKSKKSAGIATNRQTISRFLTENTVPLIIIREI